MPPVEEQLRIVLGDRKSTRLNSSHLGTSYAVFCLKKTGTNSAVIRRGHAVDYDRSKEKPAVVGAQNSDPHWRLAPVVVRKFFSSIPRHPGDPPSPISPHSG